VISPDLTQQMDRNKLKVMGQVWSIDAVMKNASTTIYGNVVALDESPKKKGLLYAGTDDGLIQVSDNGGATWSKTSSFPGIPANTRVNMICASQHDENVVFAIFNNHRSGDFKPYVMKSSDKGKTWTSITANLPERGSAYAIRQDHVDPELLFVGTEFGAYFSNDGGKNWTKLAGLPTIAVYDLDIQQRENDLVAATFGRGFYVLDNYTPLRGLKKENLDKKAHLFPVKDALLYVPADPLGLEGTGFQGANLWAAKNPEFGAVFTVHIKDSYKTLKDQRQEKEKALEKDKKDVAYPSFDELKKEELEEKAQLIYVIRDAKGVEVKRLITSPSKGMSRIAWNLRAESTYPVNNSRKNDNNGFLVTPGVYSVEVLLVKDGKSEPVVAATNFNVVPLNNQTLVAQDLAGLQQFRKEVADLSRRVRGTNSLMSETKDKLNVIQTAVLTYPGTPTQLLSDLNRLKIELSKCSELMYGDRTKSKHEFETSPGINERLGLVEYAIWDNTVDVSNTRKKNLKIVEEEYMELRKILDPVIIELTKIEKTLDQLNIPYIKGKDQNWKEE
jgi:hypothetical protein